MRNTEKKIIKLEEKMFDNIITPPLPGYNRKPVNTRNQKTLPMPVKILVSSYEAPRSQKKKS